MKAQFKQIPGFPKYETDGKQVRTIKTGNVLTHKTGTDKYQLFDVAGRRMTPTIKQINDAFKTSVLAKKETPAKASPVKKVAQPKAGKKPSAQPQEVKDILASDAKKYIKIYKLHLLGLSKPEIQKLTGSTPQVVTRDIWLFTTGQKHL